MTISGRDHWWQNWSKTHAYVAERMFFPRSAAEISAAIRAAEAECRPLRAVGGGWSFSDAALPGMTTTNRPNVYGVEALAGAASAGQRFPNDPLEASIASVDYSVTTDGPKSMVMLNQTVTPPFIDPMWIYNGGGGWVSAHDGRSYPRPEDPAGFMDFLAKNSFRPIRAVPTANQGHIEEGDRTGSLVMFDLKKSLVHPDRDWFYKGGGVWSVGVFGDSPPDQGNLQDLSGDHRLLPSGPASSLVPPIGLSPRPAHSGESLSRLLSQRVLGASETESTPARSEPVYLLNTRSLVSSLQGQLPGLLSDHAIEVTSEHPSNAAARRFFFHVEAGVTIAELGPLLAHQSPRLGLHAISGSPGATLAGALSTATHGAEFNWTLLVDTVKAVHLVGPGGLQWWIEGEESIADPARIQVAYPEIHSDRIISGTSAINGILPQDWLKAAVVSMGSMGVLYSVVLEVVPLFGVREVVEQTTWSKLDLGAPFSGKDLSTLLQAPDSKAVSTRMVAFLQDGTMNGTGIPRAANQYADLAINPNKTPTGDFDCWIGNREQTAQVPIDPQPSETNPTTGMVDGITRVPGLTDKIRSIFGFGGDAWGFPNTGQIDLAIRKINRVTAAADFVDVALDAFLTPMGAHPDVAQPFLTGLLSGLLGTANSRLRSDKTGVSVGAVGFPDSGVMGTAIEIALAPADAFGFLQTEILDHVGPEAFFGYVSIRLCKRTETLMGMQQFGDADSPSVMIEVVGYGSESTRSFMRDLQQRTVNRMAVGFDAMLHWGLENDKLTDQHLRASKPLQALTKSGMSKLDTFKAVRALIGAASPASCRVFDNGFTERLGLSTLPPTTDLSYLTPLLLGEHDAPPNVSYLVPLLLSQSS